MAERQRSYQKAITWVRTNEADLLKEDNLPLWWFLQVAAELTGDAYLTDLIARYRVALNERVGQSLPWTRMIDPKAALAPVSAERIRTLEPYQRFFYHALTCQAVEMGEGDTSVYLKNEACHPAFTQVWLKDPVCTTHHLAGVLLMHRAGCMPHSELLPLETALLNDIHQQMQWDVVVRDAYLQRLMMLMWRGQPSQVKPVWLKRALQAQQADGGWVGGRQLPELPEWAQPWLIRSRLATWFPSRFHLGKASDFHASAQGLLISAMAITENRR